MMEQHNKCPPHYWVIDSEDIGRCKYCPAVKDFRKLQKLSNMEKQTPDAVGLFPLTLKSGKERSHRWGRPPKYA